MYVERELLVEHRCIEGVDNLLLVCTGIIARYFTDFLMCQGIMQRQKTHHRAAGGQMQKRREIRLPLLMEIQIHGAA